MRADLDMKVKQAFRETPKGLAAVVGATAVIIGALAGVPGVKLGQTPQQLPLLPTAPRCAKCCTGTEHRT